MIISVASSKLVLQLILTAFVILLVWIMLESGVTTMAWTRKDSFCFGVEWKKTYIVFKIFKVLGIA